MVVELKAISCKADELSICTRCSLLLLPRILIDSLQKGLKRAAKRNIFFTSFQLRLSRERSGWKMA